MQAEYTFTSNEIKQLANLTRLWATGIVKIDARRYSKKVRAWARLFNLIKMVDGRYWTDGRHFDACRELPPAVLFEILKPAIERSSGYSINKAPEWECLNVYPATSHHNTNRDLVSRETALYRLHMAGLIWFQAMGSVWRIEIREG